MTVMDVRFQELMIPALFDTVRPAGLSIEWLHGQDICPEELYRKSILVSMAEPSSYNLAEIPAGYFE